MRFLNDGESLRAQNANNGISSNQVVTFRITQGFSTRGFCEGGNLNTWVAHAPVAKINFASNPCENL